MYEEYFGLTEEPFKLTPDPKYLYLSKRHLEAISCLHYGVDRRKGFIQITGEVGSGKTTLCRSFLGQLKENVKYALIFNPRLSEALILKTIIEDFGIVGKLRNKKDYFDAINNFLLEKNSMGENVVLIIDEAQDLTPRVLEQIRLLSNLETETDKLLQIVFLGQPEFRDILKQPSMLQLRQRITIRYHLTALTFDEMIEYIYHRLMIAGATDQSIIFTPKALSVVFEYSKGIPRLVNSLCDKILMAAYVNDARQITYQVAEEAVCEIEGVEPEHKNLDNLLNIGIIEGRS
ncbi:ExeA family protein [Candidatus Omnitrophota bacterium]